VKSNGKIEGFDEWRKTIEANGVLTPPPTSVSSEASNGNGHPVKKAQKIKVVRFSPTIEAREFDLSSPVISPIKSPGASPVIEEVHQPLAIAENQEHLQLSLEEAFFLVYGLGVLQVYCDDSDTILPASSLLPLFRRHSYFPPRSISAPAEPDDPFMLSYAAYHHYRSLGWVVRSGVKFSVDFLLYNRGPAFSHADFALIILPSYSHAYWSETDERRKAVAEKTGKTWWWLHGMNRVQSQVVKTLVLCYVDVPPPLSEEERGYQADIAKLFARYRIRDVTVKRWTPNRTRD
jgi:tRNA-splicing endonuclease subunit Sen2